jgi:lipopolysaccharide/colanic/teichoic acid biosynthesis glycosyltransferase
MHNVRDAHIMNDEHVAVADADSTERLSSPRRDDALMPYQPTPALVRLVEVPIAALILVLSLPVMALLALLIRLDSPGPALFCQWRLGAGGRKFLFVKFRTFYSDAKTRFPELFAYQYDEEQVRHLKFKIMDDPRATRVGRWLRTSSLDELPNFWNVVTGDMALVGPRPEIPEMLRYYHGDMRQKFSVRPGVTGMAQISGRGRLGFLETVELDVGYVKNRTAWGDIKIFAKTVKMVLLRDGAF